MRGNFIVIHDVAHAPLHACGIVAAVIVAILEPAGVIAVKSSLIFVGKPSAPAVTIPTVPIFIASIGSDPEVAGRAQCGLAPANFR